MSKPKLQTSKDRSNKLVSDLRSSQDRRLSIQDKIKFFEENLASAQKSISDLDTLLTYQRNELNGLRQSRTNMDKLSKRVEEQLNIALMILERAQEAVRGYDSEMSALENVAGDEIAIAKLNSLGQSSALQGYYGPLRNLIRFSDDYSKAIAAIGRDWLNAIIVKDPIRLIGSGSLLMACSNNSSRLITSRLESQGISTTAIGRFLPLKKGRTLKENESEVRVTEASIQDELWDALRKYGNLS